MSLPDHQLSVRTGVDFVDVPEFRSVFERHPAFRTRVFTSSEQAACDAHPDPAPHYAARFAAKEAACKALGIGLSPLGIDRALQDIEVVRKGRAPTLALRGRPLRHARRLGVSSRAVSLSHAGSGALASVVLLTASSQLEEGA